MISSFVKHKGIVALVGAISMACALFLSVPAYAADATIVEDPLDGLVEQALQTEQDNDVQSTNDQQSDQNESLEQNEPLGQDEVLPPESTDDQTATTEQADEADDNVSCGSSLTPTSTDSPAPAPRAAAPASDDVPMYRLYNAYSGEHLYTSDKSERNHLSKIGWFYEGIAWMAPKSGTPVYRLYNPYSGDHHYTTEATERDYLARIGWNKEGIGWYSVPNTDSSRIPIYRQFNPNEVIGTHNFTADKSENDHLARIGWRAEGIAWYGHAKPASFKDDMAPWTAHVSGDAELDRRLDLIVKAYGSLANCFNYVKNLQYIGGVKYWSNPRILSDSTTIAHAKNMIRNNGGNCYQFASLFSWLARDLGYNAQVISGWVYSASGGKAPHGWVEIKQNGTTYVCDPDLAHELPGHNWYMVTYAQAPVSYYNW